MNNRSTLSFLFSSFLICIFSPARSEVATDEVLLQRLAAVDQISSEEKVVDVTGRDPRNFGILKSYTTDSGRLVKLVDFIFTDNGGTHSKSYYFDNGGRLSATVTDSLRNDPDGTQSFHSDIWFFDSGKPVRNLSKTGRFAAGEEFSVEKLKLEPATELGFDDRSAKEFYTYEAVQASRIGSIIRALHGYEGRVPEKMLLETISPDGRYVVEWEEVPGSEGDATYRLFDFYTGKSIRELQGGYAPWRNHMSHTVRWTEDSRLFVFLMDAKWTTIEAPLYRISDNGQVELLGDVYKVASDYAWRELKQINHPFTKEREEMFGAVAVDSLSSRRTVNLAYNAESKFEGPENNVRVQMTLDFSKQPVEAGGFKILGEGESASFEQSPLFTITKNRFGPVTSDTKFNLKEIRKLFPGQKVEIGSETFEEGGEKPVIHVTAGDEVLLTILPVDDDTKLASVWTRSRGCQTQTGITVGDRFGDVFSSIQEGIWLEGISGEVIAQSPGIRNITYRFMPGSPNIDIADLPPYSELKNWQVASIEWIPGM
ncbi:MAG: DUF1131 family protein [Verrucomicrobiales bacterium]|nr:DUF1131 family protein [Verrucomicrobiales bacterium]